MPAIPTTPKGLRTRAAILRAGRRVFARDGYVNATMSAVKEEAGVSLGGLYRYFADKEGLFEAVIGDIHEQLYRASGATGQDFAAAPYDALLAANRGYLETYRANRDVMRALVEVATVQPRFRDQLWRMRNRHIDRFVRQLRATHGVVNVDGVPARLVAEAAACMVEQCAYVWFAQDAVHDSEVSVEDAAAIVTRGWYNLFFPAADLRLSPAG